MRLHLLLAVTSVIACLTTACSDDSSSSPPSTTVDSGGVDTATAADTNVAVDTAVAEDTSPSEDSSTPVDAATPADSSTPDTMMAADTMTATDTAPPADGGSPSAVRIHEVYVDRALEGDKVEFIELSGAPGTPIGSLWIRALKPDASVYWKLRVADAGTVMPASGLWVIGTATITKVNKIYSLAQFGLDNSGGSIQLTDDAVSATTALDTLGYGTVVAMAATDPKATSEGTAATLAASGSTGKTIGRKSVPGDSNNNSTDFCVMNATPGVANGSCL